MALRIEEFEMNEELEVVVHEKRKADVVSVAKGDWERLTDKQVIDEKMKFLEGYFTTETKPIPSNVKKWGRSFYTVIRAENEKSQSAINKLWDRYSYLFKQDYEVFMDEVFHCVTSAVLQFNPDQNFYNWKNVNIKGTEENSRIHGYIVGKKGQKNISVLESLISQYLNFVNWKRRSGNNIDELPVTSFDSVLFEDEEGGEITVGETLGEDSGLYAQQDGWIYDDNELDMVYQSKHSKPHFVVWWNEFLEQQKVLRASTSERTRAKAVLTAHQIEYIEVMSKYYIGELLTGVQLELENEDEKEDEKKVVRVTYELQKKKIEIENLNRRKKSLKPYKVYTQDDIYEYNQIIRKNVIGEYNRQFPNGGLTFLGMRRMEQMNLLQEAYTIVHPPEPKRIGGIKKRIPGMAVRLRELSKWILANFKENVIQDIVYDKLGAMDQGNIIAALKTKGEIPVGTLQSFVLEVADKLHNLETVNEELIYTGKPFEYVDSNKKPKQKPVKTVEPKNGDVYIYDAEGNLKEILTPKPMEKPKYKKRKATMGGLINDNDNF